MAISIFPSTAAEFVSNNFVVDMNDTTNNTADTGGVKQAGPYSISFSSGDTSFDIYLIDSDGNSVGYTNSTSITATGLFTSVVILGVSSSEIISFTYQGVVTNADGEGDEPGAGAYLESITNTDLPNADDTTTVNGGNFGADTQIFFESGATSLEAKNIVVNSSTQLIATRPDVMDTDLDPWSLRAVTSGVSEPTGTNANILTDVITTGAKPSWVTTTLDLAVINTAYSDTLEATDADGAITYTITTGSLPTGLSLDSATGVISGTPTGSGQTFTATATDEGGNTTNREFTLAVQLATGGTVSLGDDNFIYHTFTSTDDFDLSTASIDVEYLVVAGGGGGGSGTDSQSDFAGGGGAGGLRNGSATVTSNQTITVGAGGATGTQGSNSSFGSITTATGGGFGGGSDTAGANGGSGGSGGGAMAFSGGGSGGGSTAGGNNGGSTQADADPSAGGGGAGQVGQSTTSAGPESGGDGGDGLQFTAYANASGLIFDGGYFAGGGGGVPGGLNRMTADPGFGGLGGGGNGAATTRTVAAAGEANSGGGGGGGSYPYFEVPNIKFGAAGGSGVVIVRY